MSDEKNNKTQEDYFPHLTELPNDAITQISQFAPFHFAAKKPLTTQSKTFYQKSQLEHPDAYMRYLGFQLNTPKYQAFLEKIQAANKEAGIGNATQEYDPSQLKLICQVLHAVRASWHLLEEQIGFQYILSQLENKQAIFHDLSIKIFLKTCQNNPNIAAKVLKSNFLKKLLPAYHLQTEKSSGKFLGSLTGAIFGLIAFIVFSIAWICPLVILGESPIIFSILLDPLPFISYLTTTFGLWPTVAMITYPLTLIAFTIGAHLRAPYREKRKVIASIAFFPITILIFISQFVYLGYRVGYKNLCDSAAIKKIFSIKTSLRAFYLSPFVNSDDFRSLFGMGGIPIAQIADEYNKSTRGRMLEELGKEQEEQEEQNTITPLAGIKKLQVANNSESAGENDSLLSETKAEEAGIELQQLRRRSTAASAGDNKRSGRFFSSPHTSHDSALLDTGSASTDLTSSITAAEAAPESALNQKAL